MTASRERWTKPDLIEALETVEKERDQAIREGAVLSDDLNETLTALTMIRRELESARKRIRVLEGGRDNMLRLIGEQSLTIHNLRARSETTSILGPVSITIEDFGKIAGKGKGDQTGEAS